MHTQDDLTCPWSSSTSFSLGRFYQNSHPSHPPYSTPQSLVWLFWFLKLECLQSYLLPHPWIFSNLSSSTEFSLSFWLHSDSDISVRLTLLLLVLFIQTPRTLVLLLSLSLTGSTYLSHLEICLYFPCHLFSLLRRPSHIPFPLRSYGREVPVRRG